MAFPSALDAVIKRGLHKSLRENLKITTSSIKKIENSKKLDLY